jgi:hypothetical protein
MLPVKCAADGQSFELPEDLVKEKTERFGSDVRFYCHSHMEGNHHGKYRGKENGT